MVVPMANNRVDALPLELQHRIYAHALAIRLAEPSRALYELGQLVGPNARTLPRPAVVTKALRMLAAHLRCSEYDRPGDQPGRSSGVLFHYTHTTPCRLLRHVRFGVLRTRLRARFPRASDHSEWPEYRAWFLESLDLAVSPSEYERAASAAFLQFGLAPRSQT